MEIDTAKQHLDGKTPVLELYVWIDTQGKIWFSHYRKPMANTGVVSAKSGMSTRTKKTILFQEGMRRLVNMHPDLPWKEKAVWLSELNLRMRQAQYPRSFRQGIINRVVGAYSKLMEEHIDGHSMYQTRQKEKTTDQTQWFRQKGYQTTASIPVTLNGQLRRDLTDALNKTMWNVKILDSLGPTVTDKVMRRNHNPPPSCEKPNCVMCRVKPSYSKCFQPNIGYTFVCNRSPCSDNIKTDNLSADRLIRQLTANPNPEVSKPALYVGESY